MTKRSSFQAPRALASFEEVTAALRDVQEALDAATITRAKLKLYTSDFSLVAGSFHRVSSQTAAGIKARLPSASGENLADPIYISLEGMRGPLEVWAAPGQTVNGGPTATFDVDGIIALWSNGTSAWSGIAQVPAESPAGEALDANYLLGAAHASLPNGSVGTDTSLIDFAATPGGAATWTFDTAAFLALIDSTSILVSGTTLVRAAITGAVAIAQNANTSVFSGIRANGVATTDRTNINFPNQTYITWSGVDDAGNDEIELRANFLGSFYAEDGVGAFQTPFISFDNSSHLNSAIVNNIGTSGYINVSWDVSLTAGYAWTGVHSFTATGFTVTSSSTSRIEGLTVVVEATGAGSDLVLISGRDVDVNADRDFVVDAAEAISLTSAGNTTDRINLTAAAGRVDLTALETVIDSSGSIGGFLRIKESAASTPSVPAGWGTYSVDDSAPSTPRFTDDINVDHSLAYVEDVTPITSILEIRFNQAADAAISESVPAGCTWFEVEGVGGGGGGGGADADSVKETCAGGGGGSGGFFRHRFTVTTGAITGAIGAAGTAGANTGGNGGTGGTTSVIYDGVTINGVGGNGGTGVSVNGALNTMVEFSLGGTGANGDANATERCSGGEGMPGIMWTVSGNPNSGCGGNGAASYYGGGGRGGQTNVDSGSSAGRAGEPPGSGGGGGARTSTGAASTGATGGAGAPGCMKITFYSGTRPTEASIT